MDIIHKVKDRENGCPFGQKCDQCNLYRPLYKTDAHGDVTAIFDCQWNHLATLIDEMKGRVLGVQAATEGVRNEVSKKRMAAALDSRQVGRYIDKQADA